MQKRFDAKKRFSKPTVTILFLSLLTLMAIMAPVVKAQGMSVTLTPSEGPPGTQVIVQAANYIDGDYTFSVTFGATNVGTIYTDPSMSIGTMAFNVPTVASGQYVVKVTGSLSGDVNTAIFTVTQAPSATPTETSPGTSTATSTGTSTGVPLGISPTNTPVTKGSGYGSAVLVAIISVVVAFACVMTALYVRRGKREEPSVQETSTYKPTSSVENRSMSPSRYSAQENAPYTSKYSRYSVQENSPYTSRYSTQENSPYSARSSVSSARYPVSSKINQTATRSPAPPHTKVCKHCKRLVRDDLNVCPYCSKKLR